jgi:hypothetical protein
MNVPPATGDAIQLSIVATSRNDDHGGFLTRRTQQFVDGLVAQCKRHGLRAELILVEWNPPPDRAPLIDELRWPADHGPCDIRILTVPPDVHRRFAHADKIRMFQMLAKNAGIRRARGRFVLATNIDILFSDEAVQFLRDRLQPGYLYLADRVDVPAEVPADADFDAVLEFCDKRAFRINSGGLTLERRTERWRRRDLLKAAAGGRFGYILDLLEKLFALPARMLANPAWVFRRIVDHGLSKPEGASDSTAARSPTRLPRGGLVAVIVAGVWRAFGHMMARGARGVLQLRMPFTNACGDFTAMAREDWFLVRGYAERNLFSWHLDTLLVYQAGGCGIRTRRLAPKARVFHIDHGGGYAPEHAADLFKRLDSQGIPFIDDEELQRLHTDFERKKRAGQDTRLNDGGWGLAVQELPEARPGAA